jgi:short-subunit dehydrogenase
MSGDGYALITGASSGIGECFARALARRRKNLVLVARSADKLERLAAELRSSNAVLKIEVLPYDLSASNAGTALANLVKSRQLEIDLLVNNAGFGARGEFWNLPIDRLDQMLRLNLLGLMDLTHGLVQDMVQRRRGALINVSSTASFQAVPWNTAYSSSKAFVTNFSIGLERELKPYGVTVVTLCPGGTETHFFEASEYHELKFPGGLQSPEEVAEAGLRRLDRGGGLEIPRLINKAGVVIQRFVPRSWVVWMTASIFRPKPHEP